MRNNNSFLGSLRLSQAIASNAEPNSKSRRSPLRRPRQTLSAPADWSPEGPYNERNLLIIYRGQTLEQKTSMQKNNFVRITVWVVVISMVLSLAVASIALLF